MSLSLGPVVQSIVSLMHTCDKFKKGIREVFFPFQGGFQKCIEYIGKLLIHFREIS